jgi:hypothetical protein
MILENGVGNGNKLFVDANNQGHMFGITLDVILDALHKGNAYNINTGPIALTTNTESGVIYFKNDEAPVNGESTIVIDAIAIGIDDSGTTSGMSSIKIIKNPTAGTVVSDATAVDMNENRNFGSAKSLNSTTLVYKGGEGKTLTDGTDFALFYQDPGTRGFYPVNIEIERGNSIGVKVDTNTTSGTTNIYVALILHKLDGKNFNA